MFALSIGIMAYNEEANIARLLQSLQTQKIDSGTIQEIVVVSSGCTDKTEDIVRICQKRDKRIKLLVQSAREGKASAINLFLSKALGDIFVLESGDTIPEEKTFEKIIVPFNNPEIGMTGARPTPTNSKDTFIGFTIHLLWFLHHRIALNTPKLGELVAFRNFVKKIPNDTAVDEASIEAIVRDRGYKLYYASDAIVKNKGPENVKDFLRQRRRIAAGHKHLIETQHHKVSTLNPFKIVKILIREHSWSRNNILWTLGAIGLEAIGRFLGYYDYYVRKKNPVVWDIALSTKKLD